MIDLTLCNELLAADGMSLAQQAQVAADLGYMGLEIAPATLGENPHDLGASKIAEIRQTVEDAGIRVTGLHWLLSGYPDLSITDPQTCSQAQDIMLALVDLCADLGGDVLIHGSPKQRVRPENMSDPDVTRFLADVFTPVAAQCASRAVTYCIEPLSATETQTLNTVEEGVTLVERIASPAFLTMIDCSAAGQTEPPVAGLIRDWVPRGVIGHIHVNDTNRGAPGMGSDPFPDIVTALSDVGWSRPVGVEPFWTLIDSRVTAAIGISTIRAIEKAQAS